MTRRGRKSRVARDKGNVESLGESDVDRIERCQILAQIPSTFQKGRMRIPRQREIKQVVNRLTGTSRGNDAGHRLTSQNLGDFDVEQMRGVQRLKTSRQSRIYVLAC